MIGGNKIDEVHFFKMFPTNSRRQKEGAIHILGGIIK